MIAKLLFYVIIYTFLVEGWQSGLMQSLGKRPRSQGLHRFKSCPFRHCKGNSPTIIGKLKLACLFLFGWPLASLAIRKLFAHAKSLSQLKLGYYLFAKFWSSCTYYDKNCFLCLLSYN